VKAVRTSREAIMEDTLVGRLQALGTRGVLVQMAQRGQIIERRCESPIGPISMAAGPRGKRETSPPGCRESRYSLRREPGANQGCARVARPETWRRPDGCRGLPPRHLFLVWLSTGGAGVGSWSER
jgi:hypothetical protein